MAWWQRCVYQLLPNTVIIRSAEKSRFTRTRARS